MLRLFATVVALNCSLAHAENSEAGYVFNHNMLVGDLQACGYLKQAEHLRSAVQDYLSLLPNMPPQLLSSNMRQFDRLAEIEFNAVTGRVKKITPSERVCYSALLWSIRAAREIDGLIARQIGASSN